MSGHIQLRTELAHRTISKHGKKWSVEMPLKRSQKRRLRPGPGRPDSGIRSGYARVEVYLPAAVKDGLDRLADRRETQTGISTRRAHLIREALATYLQTHLPEGGPY
jgi:hypothetical protein